ncbi:hypothetical protein CO046_01520 [Candidatus Peregrinibacteria bacterium CG_4_9_14_0_2_um_filter_53_11]|nr:MAG: hypothetical protein CO046_01520 [Candidatus Peregrinibacteria bacterium CG_4_9_14_0_2_um_filter_53_11]
MSKRLLAALSVSVFILGACASTPADDSMMEGDADAMMQQEEGAMMEGADAMMGEEEAMMEAKTSAEQTVEVADPAAN